MQEEEFNQLCLDQQSLVSLQSIWMCSFWPLPSSPILRGGHLLHSWVLVAKRIEEMAIDLGPKMA